MTFLLEGFEESVTASRVLVNAEPRTFYKIFRQPWEPRDANEGSVIKINTLLKRLPKLKVADVTTTDSLKLAPQLWASHLFELFLRTPVGKGYFYVLMSHRHQAIPSALAGESTVLLTRIRTETAFLWVGVQPELAV